LTFGGFLFLALGFFPGLAFGGFLLLALGFFLRLAFSFFLFLAFGFLLGLELSFFLSLAFGLFLLLTLSFLPCLPLGLFLFLLALAGFFERDLGIGLGLRFRDGRSCDGFRLWLRFGRRLRFRLRFEIGRAS